MCIKSSVVEDICTRHGMLFEAKTKEWKWKKAEAWNVSVWIAMHWKVVDVMTSIQSS